MNRSPSSGASSGQRIAIAIDLEQFVPWHHDCCEGILRYGRSRGWSCTISPFPVGPGWDGGPAASGRYDAVVGRIDVQLAEAAGAQGIPVVNHWMNTPARGLPSVGIDFLAVAQTAGEHLLTCGYRSLAYLGAQDEVVTGQYMKGLERATDQAGLSPPSLCLFDTGNEVTSSREKFSQFLADLDRWLVGLKPPAGLLVRESTLARYVVQQCQSRGLSVPGDVGVVMGHDDMSTVAISPSLTVVENDWIEVGYQAALFLDELMQGKKAHPLHRLVAPGRLIQRDSTDVFHCEDDLVKEAMGYIAEHCREELTVEVVAEAMSVSNRTLQRRFDEALGRSVKAEINRLRINRLKQMVQETGVSFIDLADAFGFSSSGQFSRYFSKAVGMTPRAYRKKYGEGA